MAHTVEKREALELLGRYTKQLLNGGETCIMCALAEHRDPAYVIYENAEGVVLLDRFASRRGHLLVVAKRHVEKVSDLDWHAFSQIQRLCFDACGVLEHALQPKRVYVAALGASTALSMSYPHYHLHVVPVTEDDDSARPAQVFSWSAGVVVYEPGEARDLVAALEKVWPRPRGNRGGEKVTSPGS